MNKFLPVVVAILASGGVATAPSKVLDTGRVIDAVNIPWLPLVSDAGGKEALGFESARMMLQPGVYHVRLRIKVDESHVPAGSVLSVQLLTHEEDTSDSVIMIPLPMSGSRVAIADWNWWINETAASTGIVIRITANSNVRIVVEQLRLKRVSRWHQWLLRIARLVRVGQASLRTRGALNSVPPVYYYPIIAGTNRVQVTGGSFRLQILGGVMPHGGVLELMPGPASVRAIAHYLSLRERTCYRLRVKVVGSVGHPREDRVSCDVYSAAPPYDPPNAEVTVTGPLLRQGRQRYDCYFRTAEVPPAVMLRIMAALTCTAQVTEVSLEQISYGHYLIASALPYLATGQPSMVILPALLGVGAVAVWMLNAKRRVTRHVGVFVTCALLVVALSFATRAEGIWLRGNVISMLIGGVLLWVLCGWWVWWLCRRVFREGYSSLMAAAGAFAWLTCGLTGLSSFMPIAYALPTLVLVTAVLGIIAGSMCGSHTRKRGWESWDWLCVISIWMLGMAIMLGPFGDGGLKGFFSECIDGFMYATTSEYFLDPAKARTTWDSQVLEYVRQVTELVRRTGTMVSYAAFMYLTGEPAVVTYRLWHATVHACLGVTTAGAARRLGARRWAAWLAGVFALTIPVVQLPVYGNSLAQSGGLLCLSGLALIAVAALRRRLTGQQRFLAFFFTALLVMALLMVYREMMIYLVVCGGVYTLLRLGRLWLTSRWWRVVLSTAGSVTLIAVGIFIGWYGTERSIVLIREIVMRYFPYLDAGDIRTRLGPWHAFGGVDLSHMIGAEGTVTWAPLLGGVLACVGALVALYGVVRLQAKVRDGVIAALISCAALYLILAMVIPWPYALKKHLSVCGLAAASLLGVGVDQLCYTSRRGVRLLGVAMVMILLFANSAITWKIFRTAASVPHYFDRYSEELRLAVERNVPSNALIFVDTDERMEKFFYTLRHYRVTNTDTNEATYAIVQPNRRTALTMNWGGEKSIQILYANERFELLKHK